jgi:hypothetical protein
MFLAAWARAEGCPVQFVDRRLELYPREPSDELVEAFERGRALVAGVVGWAVPLRYTSPGRPWAASWPATLSHCTGPTGDN